jgi:Protein of unknown function (DUF2934)
MAENPSTTPYVEQQIRERAYQIYLARGGQNGDEVADWIAAERELKESNQQKGKKTRAAAVSL